MTNPMQMMQELMQFRDNIKGDPKKMVENLIATGQINQQQLNLLQGQAAQIMKTMRQMGIKI